MSVTAKVVFEKDDTVLIHVMTNVVRTQDGGIHKASARKVRNTAIAAAREVGFTSSARTEEFRWDAAPHLDSPLASPFLARRSKTKGSQLVILSK